MALAMIAPLLLGGSVAAARRSGADGGPTIFWASSPVGPNQTVIVAGANFPASVAVHLAYDHNSSTMPGLIPTIEPAQVTPASVKFTIPIGVKLGAYTVHVCPANDHNESDCSNMLPLNSADPWCPPPPPPPPIRAPRRGPLPCWRPPHELNCARG